jgi:hypothetical protein
MRPTARVTTLAGSRRRTVDLALLKIYLNDHLAGAHAGLELARRTWRENEDHPVGHYFSQLVPELAEDRATLRRVMDALGVAPDVFKQRAAWVMERVGRLKLNGRLVRYSPLSRLHELEGLVVATQGRLSLWRLLRRLAREDLRLDAFDFDALVERAQAQQATLERLRIAAAREAFVEPIGFAARTAREA